MNLTEVIEKMKETATDIQKEAICKMEEYIVETIVNGDVFDVNKLFKFVEDVIRVYPEYIGMVYTLSTILGVDACDDHDEIFEAANDIINKDISDYVK